MKKTLYILVLLLAFIVGKLYAQHTTLMLRHNQSDYIGTFPADFSLTVNYEANDVGWTSGLQFVLTQPTNLILYIPDAYQREVMIQANDDVVTTEPFYPSTYNMPQYTQGGPVTIQGINLQPGSYDMLVRPNGRGTIYITGMAVARPNGDPEVAPLAEPAALMDPSAIKLASTLNYTAVIRPRAEVGSLEMSGGVLGNYAAANASVSVQYYDGFSRPVQQVDYRASPGGKDLVRVLEYTALDRAGRQWLPAAFRTNGAYFQPSAIKARSRLSNGDQAPFSFSTYENSELDRITAQTGAGNAWHAAGRSDRTDYLTNGAVSALSCRKYTSGSNGPLFAGLYGDSLLNVVRTTDENGQQSLVFTDISGQQVLHRKILDGVNLDTYYIYDDLGNLSYVLPPGSGADVSLPSQTLLDSYCYQYRYDGRNRPIAKKLPGRGWEFFVYNRQGQVVAEQDALQRAASPQRWTFTRYDNIGRVIATGLYQQNGSTGDSAAVPSTSSRDQLQASVNGLPQWDVRDTGNIGTGYGNTSFPAADAGVLHYLSISWYDDYTFPGAALVSSQGLVSGNTAGLQTGARLYQTDGTSPYLKATYYDRRGRVSEEVSQNHVNGSDRVRNRWTFRGELLSSVRTHSGYGKVTTVVDSMEYDNMGRLLRSRQRIDGAPYTVLASLTYDELGRLSKKKVHSTNGLSYLDSTSYGYQVRSWPKSISAASGFSQTLRYEDGAVPQWNGNISEQVFSNGGTAKTFSYTYDGLNRLLTGQVSGTELSEVLSYDKMGNILSLKRDGGTTRTYSYSGNRLLSVSGLTTQLYQYDANGNATYDARNQKSIRYNLLGLPDSVSGGLRYRYAADGTKLSKSYAGQTRSYVEGIEYKGNTIDLIHNSEGVARYTGSGYSYEYNVTDHLGNVRLSFYRNPVTGLREVLQRDNYFAFGKRSSVLASSNSNRYLYNGKEQQDELGGQYDYGARFYDAEIGRWNVVDPLAEMHYNLNGYNYVMNNPIIFKDLFGLDTVSVNNLNIKNYKEDVDVVKMEEAVVTRTSYSNSRNFRLSYAISRNVDKLDMKGVIVDSDWESVKHYYIGNGQPATIGKKSLKKVLLSPVFIELHKQISKGRFKTNTGINFTKHQFHIGRTTVNIFADPFKREVTYTLFEGDGFWDPDFIDEKYYKGPQAVPDGKGSNLERGGVPYDYNPTIITIPFY